MSACNITAEPIASETSNTTLATTACTMNRRRSLLGRARGMRDCGPPASGRRLLNVGNPVTRALHRVQQRPVERLVDRLAQVVQVAAQRVRVGQAVAPDLALDLLPAHNPRRLAPDEGAQLPPDRRPRPVLPRP